MEKTTHRLKIAGEEYRIVSTESTEYMSELAHEIDLKMNDILRGNRVTTTQAAVLVALEYANEAKKQWNNEKKSSAKAELFFSSSNKPLLNACS